MSEELEKVNLSELERLGIKMEDTRLIIPDTLDTSIVARVATGIFAFAKRWQWWFLDCYLFIVEKEGQEAASQFLDAQEYSNGYLHNVISYGSRIDVHARVNDLSFAHYEPIAQLPKKEQRTWVEKARPNDDPNEGATKGMSRDQLREEVTTHLNEAHAGANGSSIDNEKAQEAQIIYRECKRCKTCPDCHGTQSIRVN